MIGTSNQKFFSNRSVIRAFLAIIGLFFLATSFGASTDTDSATIIATPTNVTAVTSSSTIAASTTPSTTPANTTPSSDTVTSSNTTSTSTPTKNSQAMTYNSLRKMAYSGQSDKAIVLAQRSLKEREDLDVRVLLGTMLSWHKRYGEATEQLQYVLHRAPKYADASEALGNVEIWSKNYRRALQVIDVGLKYHPKNKALVEERKIALDGLTNGSNIIIPVQGFSRRAIPVVLDTNTENSEKTLNALSIDQEVSHVSDLNQNWQLTSIAYQRNTPIGPIIGRVNQAYRYQQSGTQYEIDAYPRLTKSIYFYLNYGYSSTSYFPQHEYGFEAFFALPHAYEFSIGERILQFQNSTSDIYTGSIGKYIGNYWISYRPYISHGLTNTLTIRRYFSNEDSYVSLVGGYGSGLSSLTLDDIQNPNDINPDRTKYIGLDGHIPIMKNLIFTWFLTYHVDNFPNSVDRTETDADIGLIWRF